MRTTAQRATQAAQPQSGATAEHAAQTQSGTPDDGHFLAANSVQSGAPHGENSPAAERIQNGAQNSESPPVKGPAFLCRAMRPEDVPACAAIEATVPDGWSADALAEELLQPTARLFVAEISGGAQAGETNLMPFHTNANSGAGPALTPHTQPPGRQRPNVQPPDTQPPHEPAAHTPHAQPIAALAVFQLVCEEANLYTISTAPAFRRQGAARALLQYAFAQLAAQGAQTVFLEVRAQNSAAHALYTALGFEETGIRRGFYTKPTDDAVLMQQTIYNS